MSVEADDPDEERPEQPDPEATAGEPDEEAGIGDPADLAPAAAATGTKPEIGV